MAVGFVGRLNAKILLPFFMAEIAALLAVPALLLPGFVAAALLLALAHPPLKQIARLLAGVSGITLFYLLAGAVTLWPPAFLPELFYSRLLTYRPMFAAFLWAAVFAVYLPPLKAEEALYFYLSPFGKKRAALMSLSFGLTLYFFTQIFRIYYDKRTAAKVRGGTKLSIRQTARLFAAVSIQAFALADDKSMALQAKGYSFRRDIGREGGRVMTAFFCTGTVAVQYLVYYFLV
jgi:hypothetical protein